MEVGTSGLIGQLHCHQEPRHLLVFYLIIQHMALSSKLPNHPCGSHGIHSVRKEGRQQGFGLSITLLRNLSRGTPSNLPYILLSQNIILCPYLCARETGRCDLSLDPLLPPIIQGALLVSKTEQTDINGLCHIMLWIQTARVCCFLAVSFWWLLNLCKLQFPHQANGDNYDTSETIV